MDLNSIKDVMESYLSRGFGSMNKNDFEVFVFHWLINNKTECKGKSDFVISQCLKIPESKVARLRYEAGLKYTNPNPDMYREELKMALKKAKCQEGTAEGKITMSISDKLLRQYLSNLLMEDGRFLDGSFNSNIVTMSAGNFVFVIESLFLDEKDRKALIAEAKKDIKEGKQMPKTVAESLKQLGISLSKSVLEKIIGSSADTLVETIGTDTT